MDLKLATTLASVVLLIFMLTGGYYLQVSNGTRETIPCRGNEANRCRRERMEMKSGTLWSHEKLFRVEELKSRV